MVWHKRNSQRRHCRHSNNLFSHKRRGTVSTGTCDTRGGGHQRQLDQRNNKPSLYHYFLVGLLSISPAFASEDPKVSNTSNPVAAATGNVTNQAIQFQNNGAPSRQYFGPNSSCNASTMQLSPFYMGNDTIPHDSEGYTRGNNWGLQINFSIPLDGSMVELCKGIARRHEEKMRLDYELVRALKCTEIMSAGFQLRPGSRVEVLCHDVVPIVAVNEKSN